MLSTLIRLMRLMSSMMYRGCGACRIQSKNIFFAYFLCLLLSVRFRGSG